MLKVSVITYQLFQRPVRTLALFCPNFKSYKQQNHCIGSSATSWLNYQRETKGLPQILLLSIPLQKYYSRRPADGWQFTASKGSCGWSTGGIRTEPGHLPACPRNGSALTPLQGTSASLRLEQLLATIAKWSSLIVKKILTPINICK